MPNKLREVRGETKMMELAARIRCSAAMLSAIERYDYQPRDETKERIAAGLGVSTSTIWPSDAVDLR